MRSENKLSWLPRYTLTPAIARVLMDIEATRAVVEHTPLPPAAEVELRRRARDLLLPKLISGEVDVEKIDVRMPDNSK